MLPFISGDDYFIEMSETELLQAFKENRSETAFAELVRRYSGLVFSVAKRRLANTALAEDITQIVFIRFAKAPPRVQSPAELAAWLHRTTVHVTIDIWRSEVRRRNREQQAMPMEPAEDSLWEETLPNLDEALNQLRDDDRQILLLRFFGRKTMRETGESLGISEDAAKMRVSRAVERLRTQMGVGAACSVALLTTLLAERSVEAVPAVLRARLADIRLPAAAGAGGILGLLKEASGLKLIAGAALLAIIGFSVLHMIRPSKAAVVHIEAADSSTNPSSKTVQVQAKLEASNANSTSLSAAAPQKPVKMWFQVLDSESGLGIPNTKVEAAMFGAGGVGEGHDLITDMNGMAAIPEPDNPAMTHGMNVFVVAEGHVSKAVGFPDYVPSDYAIKLEPAMSASGLVVDEQGLPVSGVKVIVQGPGNVSGQRENIDFQTCNVNSDDDGSWRFSYLPLSFTNDIQFLLRKPGYAVTLPTVPFSRVNLTNLVLVIERGYAVAGTVADEQGHAIVNAKVKVLTNSRDTERSVETDEAGNFMLAGLKADNQFGPNWEWPLPQVKTNADGAFLIQEVKPFYGHTEVTLSTSGDEAISMRHEVPASEATNSQPVIKLAIQAKGFASQTVTVALTSATNVVHFVLAHGNIFRGQITDEAGDPIPNAVVQTDYDFKYQILTRYDWSTHTDASGEFNWDSAPAEKICYWFEADGYEPIRSLSLPADGTEHKIVLKKAR